MLNKLRQNYRLSNMLARVLFIVTMTFSLSWRFCAQIPVLGLYLTDIDSSMLVPACIFSAMLVAVIAHFLVPLACNIFLTYSRIHSVPIAEYVVLAFACCSCGFLISGAFNALAYFVPSLSVWISGLVQPIVMLACLILFYFVTERLYFNDVTAATYFKSYAVLTLVIVVIAGVLLWRG